MAHGILDEFVGIGAAIASAFFASRAHQMAEGGPSPKAGEVARGIVMQRLPKMFGIGREDEQMFESLRQLISPTTRGLIDLVIGEMKDYEADIFRLTVAGMPCGSELEEKLVKDPKKGQPATTKERNSWEFTEKDLRVKYLVDIADEVAHIATSSNNELAAKQVVEAMRSRRLITRSPAAQKAYELWVEMTAWVKKDILELFEADSLADITPAKVADLTRKLAQQVPDRPKVGDNPGFWRRAFQLYPVRTIILIVGIILIIVPFVFV